MAGYCEYGSELIEVLAGVLASCYSDCGVYESVVAVPESSSEEPE